jgi:hypothetical protein
MEREQLPRERPSGARTVGNGFRGRGIRGVPVGAYAYNLLDFSGLRLALIDGRTCYFPELSPSCR